MKKLMIVAAVAALSASAFAAKCSDAPQNDCQTAFTVKFSGKTADTYFKNSDGDEGDYAAIQKISGKGSLVVAEYVTEYLESVKVGKYKVGNLTLTEGELIKWSYFGKNLETISNDWTKKPGKTYKFESDFGVAFEEQLDDLALSVDQVAFGKVKVYITKDKTVKSGCGESTIEGCLPVVTPVSYSGWFTGSFTPACVEWELYDDGCVEFGGDEVALIGGTWSAKYSKKLSVTATAE